MKYNNQKYILSIDQGTTSSRAILFDENGKNIVDSQMETSLIYPKSGWVEQNPLEIWETVYEVVKEVILSPKIDYHDIAALGITNQRETTILWDKNTGEPVYNAIIWQSRQSQDICEDLINKGYSDVIKAKTGLIINPYFSATKIKWIIENVEGVKEKALKGEILFGTVDTFLVWKLTNGEKHVTDFSNASRTMLFNIHTLEWDQDLLELFGISSSMLPEVVYSSGFVGTTKVLKEIEEDLELPITSIVGDQQASLFGQTCFNQGDVKNTYGTGCFMLMNTKDKIVNSENGLLTTIAWGINDKIEYALEGSVFVAGSAVQWLRDSLKMIKKSNEVEEYSSRVEGSDGVYVVPAFVGLGTPYWDNDARGAVFGLTRGTKKEHFINATVESIAYQTKDVMEVMKKESGFSINSIGVDGGASVNNYLLQFQADILDCKIRRAGCLETTALGAAYMAGLVVGIWNSLDEIRKLNDTNQIFMRRMPLVESKRKYEGWKKAVAATRLFK